MTVRLAINGATGRMGTTLQEAATNREDLEVVLGIASSTAQSGEVPTVRPADRREGLATHNPDAVVDFSTASGVERLAQDCASASVALVSGTTGLGEDEQAALRRASEDVPVLHATNFSRGVVALRNALDAALDSLSGYDIELLETHHSGKQDAPSGTAMTLLETVADHREVEPVHGREGVQPREEGEIGVLSRRAGNVRGEHELLLADNDELLTLTHRAESRGVFAVGALDAATWLAHREAGWYTVDDVFSGATDGRAER
jgi:4-hydroxy-tetrahydrodipicolinate reductase